MQQAKAENSKEEGGPGAEGQPVAVRRGRGEWLKRSGLAHSHMDPGLNGWALMISKPPSYPHVLPQDTKPYGMRVAELAMALLLILCRHLQNPLPLATPSSSKTRAAEGQQRQERGQLCYVS